MVDVVREKPLFVEGRSADRRRCSRHRFEVVGEIEVLVADPKRIVTERKIVADRKARFALVAVPVLRGRTYRQLIGAVEILQIAVRVRVDADHLVFRRRDEREMFIIEIE